MSSIEQSSVEQRRPVARTLVLGAAIIAALAVAIWLTVVVPAQRSARPTGESATAGDTTRIQGAPIDSAAPRASSRPVSMTAADTGERSAFSGAVRTKSVADLTDRSAAEVIPEAAVGLTEEYRPISFAKLTSYEYDPFAVMDALAAEPPQSIPDQIPAKIRALDNKKAAVTGFMVPVELNKEKVGTFLLVKNRLMCCFGASVGMTDWIYVTMKPDKRCAFVPDVLVTVSGTLEVGEKVDDGMVMSIYRLDGDAVEYKAGF